MTEIPERDSEFERTEQFGQSDFGVYGAHGESALSNPYGVHGNMIIEEPIDEEEREKREDQVKKLEKFIYESGIKLSFQIIFTEIVSNGIPEEDVFKYTAMRLR